LKKKIKRKIGSEEKTYTMVATQKHRATGATQNYRFGCAPGIVQNKPGKNEL
jgi:hypothetical protein